MTAYLSIHPEPQNVLVTSFEFGAFDQAARDSVTGKVRKGKSELSPLTVNLVVGSVASDFFTAISTGSMYDSARLVVQNSDSKQTITEQYDFKALHVQTFTIAGGADTGRSTLSLGFIYDSLKITYSGPKSG